MPVVKFTEIAKDLNITEGKTYKLREVYINSEHVVLMREDDHSLRLLNENQLPSGLDKRQRFTRISLQKGSSGQEIVVVGTPEMVEQKLFSVGKKVIRG
jgi:DNA topoisomerase VI subunit A